ncbi:MurR/RpiR family transcriptional regulator [Desemzia sp. RIT804]|uniref:MurR/RpiR family transcriptional regulator n=1 Tax=Desemzia sp. RIT 804 TaxID=2810209 RepID=UPI00194E1ABA|nr:MurR/RpiR family transcriptional regulator [Desemzia sp. RIT 804]
MQVLTKLKEQMNFTNTEMRIADYIIQNITKIPTIYIEDLAKLTYTSHSTIIRLCKKMGYDGFRSFKDAISGVVYSQLHLPSEVDANFPFKQEDLTMDIAKNIANLTIDTIKKTLNQLDEELLQSVAEILFKSNHIFLFSRGDSQVRARSFQNKLVKINRFAIISEEYADEAWNASNLTPQDCALFLSYSGTSPQYKRMLQHFSNKKIPTILITGNTESDLINLAAKTIVVVQEEYDFVKVGTFASQVAFQYVLDTLYSILYAKEYRTNVENLKEKQSLIQNGILSEEL